ncbi:MAG: hypothetical protein MZV63_15900 [Marinilabiliales bacterium]|nr:hypothetical protein [Marinilabiliales bacterium]
MSLPEDMEVRRHLEPGHLLPITCWTIAMYLALSGKNHWYALDTGTLPHSGLHHLYTGCAAHRRRLALPQTVSLAVAAGRRGSRAGTSSFSAVKRKKGGRSVGS